MAEERTTERAHGAEGGHDHDAVTALPPGWSRPKPEHIPRPTYWPAVMAVGVTFMFWGVVTSFAVSVVGLLLFIIALAGWIGDMLHGA
jgi:hypothetical protein